MDTYKYPIPNLPTAQQVLEDLEDAEIMKLKEPLNMSSEDEVLKNACTSYINLQKLESDITVQNEKNNVLNELNKKLLENIEVMKKQVK